MPLRRLNDVLTEHSDFSPGWKVLTEQVNGAKIVTGLENPNFGKIESWVHCKEDGSPMYDQYVITEGPADEQGQRPLASGAIIVPFFFDNGIIKPSNLNIGLIETFRPVVRDPSTGDPGYVSLELPRGFGDLAEKPKETAIRELGEETSTLARNLYRLGNQNGGVNANSAFYATHITAFAAEVNPEIRDHTKIDTSEPILKCDFMPYKEARSLVANGKMSCGLSLAGLMLFDSFLEHKYEESQN